MTAPLPPDPADVLTRLEEVHKAATPGPWIPMVAYDSGRVVGGSDGESVAHYVSSADAAAIVAEHNAIPALLAAVRGALGEHRPLVNDAAGSPACPECLGGIYLEDPLGARSCGCWGLSTPVCSSCADPRNEKRYALPWPCPTVSTVAAALGETGGGR